MTGALESLVVEARSLVLLLRCADQTPSLITAEVCAELHAGLEAAALDLADGLAAAYSADRGSRHTLSVINEIGALQQWWRELDAGIAGQDRSRPSTWKPDSLWRAAGYEAAGREAARLGLVLSANAYRRQAARTILEAAKKRSRKS